MLYSIRVTVSEDRLAAAVTALRDVGFEQLLIESAPQDKSLPLKQAVTLGPVVEKNIALPLRRPEDAWRERVLAFLQTVHSAGEKGTSAREIARQVVDADSPSAIGTTVAHVAEQLEVFGLTLDDVFDRPRTSEGRLWVAKASIEKVIEQLSD